MPGTFSRPVCTLSLALSRNLTGEGPDAAGPQVRSQSAFIDSLLTCERVRVSVAAQRNHF